VRILLTNDDGITSDGLWAAARGLARVGHLTVIGTADDWSNGSASIRHTIGARLRRFTDLPAGLAPDVEAYSIEAPPAGAVIAGLMTGLFEPFDLVVSGANYGVNIGGDLIRSGTFGAALTGFERGVTAFAISVARGARNGEPQRWEGVSDVSERVARWLTQRSGPPTLLNVNLPNRSFADIAGARIVRPAGWSNLDRARLGAQPEEDGSWTVTAWFDLQRPWEGDIDTDAGAVLAGEIAVSHVTPMGRDAEPAPEDLAELIEALAPGGPVPTMI
jgi:5'-nucleotidase